MNVRLTKGKAFELDPNKAYIIFLKGNAVSQAEAREFTSQLKEMGIGKVLVALIQKGAYQIVEAPAVEAKLKKQAVRQVKAEAKKKSK